MIAQKAPRRCSPFPNDGQSLNFLVTRTERNEIRQASIDGQHRSVSEYLRKLLREDILQRRLDAAFAADPALRSAS